MNEPKLSRRGWRHFYCEDCDHKWKLVTRDCHSPSGEDCPKCKMMSHPYKGEIDLSVPCDELGNLTVPWDWQGFPTQTHE